MATKLSAFAFPDERVRVDNTTRARAGERRVGFGGGLAASARSRAGDATPLRCAALGSIGAHRRIVAGSMAHSPGDARALESPGTAASRGWMSRLFDAADAKPPSNLKPRRRDGPEPSWFNPEAHTEAKRSWLRGRADPAGTPGKRRDGRADDAREEEKNDAECLSVSSSSPSVFSPPDVRDASASTYVDDFGEDDTGGFLFSPPSLASRETETEAGGEDVSRRNDDDASEKKKNEKRIAPPFERFFVVGLPPDAEVTATAESSTAARAANAAGSQVEARRPQKKKPHRGASGVTHPARVLFAYPPRASDADAEKKKGNAEKNHLSTKNERDALETHCSYARADLANVESFCFPDGVATKLVERTASMSAVLDVTCGSARTPGAPGGGVERNDRSFVFSVGGGDGAGPARADRLHAGGNGDVKSPVREKGEERGDGDGGTPRVLYGVCVYAEELVRREPGVCRADRLARKTSRAAAEKKTDQDENANAREKETRREKDAAGTGTVFSFPAPRERYLVSADRCYCFLSYRPAFEWHFEVLRAVAAAERFERAREAAEAMRALGDEDEDDARDEEDDDAFLTSTGFDKKDVDVFDSMACLSESFAVVAAYESFDVSPALQRLGGAAGVSKEAVAQFGTFDASFDASKKTCTTTPPMTFPGEFFPADAFSVFEHSADRWRTATACRVLSLETMLTAATAALLERRMVVAHPNLGELSAIVFALTSAMLKPLTHRSLVLPIVPDTMYDLLEAPVPFVLGVRYKTPETRSALKQPGVVRLNAYKDAIKVSGANDASLPSLPGRLALLEALRPSYDAARSAALRAEKLGAPFPYALSVSSAAAYLDDIETNEFETSADGPQKGDEKNKNEKTLFRASARSAARDARNAAGAFLETWREYLHALVSKETLEAHAITDVTVIGDRVTVLMRDSFVESFRSADRHFADALVDTQAFQAHADAALTTF